MHCGGSRYVKVANDDGVSVTTKVAIKQFCYIPITPRLKWLFLSEETMKQMRRHKLGKYDSEDSDIMSHPAYSEAWRLGRLLTILIQNVQGIQGVSVLVCQWMVSTLTTPIVAPTIADQFCHALQSPS
jgi:hypothetical protein